MSLSGHAPVVADTVGEETALHELRPQLHVPVPHIEAARLGHPRCAFVTGGPREYLPGINCISRRLQVLNSSYPLLVMAEPEDEVHMRRHTFVNSHPSSAVLTWKRFPDPQNRSSAWRFRSAHVLDKMNLFGMPFRRLVWLDADMFVRRNVDGLCELPGDVRLATALDAEGLPNKCWPRRQTCPAACQRNFTSSQLSTSYVGKYIREWSPPPEPCPYILQSGVMVLSPLSLTTFNDLIVGPVFRGEIQSYDAGDQGLITSFTYGSYKLFGDSYMRLHPMYNVIARHAKHTEGRWGGHEHNTAALMHFTRETRPWQNPPNNATDLRTGEWWHGCGQMLCGSLQQSRHRHHHNLSWTSTSGSAQPPAHIGIHMAWYSFCGLRAPNLTSVPDATEYS
mmetsp:Transcript_4405/g.11530  ORF Transcript_4405/g.11530 Transcript_4405/m.11530 type:complete len:394 (+) Transcript_4405:152-1333(+)